MKRSAASGDSLDLREQKQLKKQKRLQRMVFRWVVVQDMILNLRSSEEVTRTWITADEVVQGYGVPVQIMVRHLHKLQKRYDACKGLPFTLLMVGAFVTMVLMHAPVIPINSAEESLVYHIEYNAEFAYSTDDASHKVIHNVGSFQRFWSWFIVGYIPLVFEQEVETVRITADGGQQTATREVSEVPRVDRGFYMNYNRIVGGIRVSQEISDEECVTIPRLLAFYNKSCVGGFDYELYPEMPGAHLMAAEYGPRRTFWLYAQDDLEVSLHMAEEKETSGWLDEQTRRIEIALPIYNVELGVHTLVTTNFYFSRGGHVWSRIIPMSTYAEWFNSGWRHFVVDLIWLACVLRLVFVETRNLCQVASHGLAGLKGYIRFWVVVDWLNIVFTCIIVVQFPLRVVRTWELNDKLASLAPANEMLDRSAYREGVAEYMKLLEQEVHNMYQFRVFMGTYPVFVMLRLFETFHAQPRLAVVTETLRATGEDMVHFLVVFMAIFLTYTAAGCVLFGRTIADFQSPSRAMITCFRLLMGDFEWKELVKIGRVEASMWFGSFVIILTLMMLNMLLAMIMEAYAVQKSYISNAPTLVTEGIETIADFRGRRKGVVMAIPDVIQVLSGADLGQFKYISLSDEMDAYRAKRRSSRMSSMFENPGTRQMNSFWGNSVSRISFPDGQGVDDGAEQFFLVTLKNLTEITSMSHHQAYKLMLEAVQFYYARHKGEADVDNVVRMTRSLNHKTKRFETKVQQLIEACTGVARDSDAEGRSGKGETQGFLDELAAARTDLAKATQWIDTELENVGDYEEASENVEVRPLWRPSRASIDDHVMRLTNTEELMVGDIVRVLDDVTTVLDSCRRAELHIREDPLRMEFLGRFVIVEEIDYGSGCVTCELCDDFNKRVMFPFGALGRDVPRTENGTGEEDPSAQSVHQLGEPADAETSEIPLEEQLAVGQKTLAEANAAIEELKTRLAFETDLKGKVAGKVHNLKQQVLSLTRENERLAGEAESHQVMRPDATHLDETSYLPGGTHVYPEDQYYSLVRQMASENMKLRAQVRISNAAEAST